MNLHHAKTSSISVLLQYAHNAYCSDPCFGLSDSNLCQLVERSVRQQMANYDNQPIAHTAVLVYEESAIVVKFPKADQLLEMLKSKATVFVLAFSISPNQCT